MKDHVEFVAKHCKSPVCREVAKGFLNNSLTDAFKYKCRALLGDEAHKAVAHYNISDRHFIHAMRIAIGTSRCLMEMGLADTALRAEMCRRDAVKRVLAVGLSRYWAEKGGANCKIESLG